MSSMTPLEKAAQRSRHLLPLVAIALIGCLGGCEYEPDDVSFPSASFPSARFPTTEADTIAPFPERGVLDAGTYLVTRYPGPFEITVPDGWVTYDGSGLGKDDPDLPDEWDIAVTFWPATHVPTDACAWRGALVQVDPTAEAFVDAMTAQASTVSTPPVKVVVGDYSGFEFDHAVESDVDITDCDGGKLCINSDLAQGCDGREYRNVGWRETYRAVDLNGERAVIVLGQPHESINPELTREARAIFDSIVFRSHKDQLMR
ncbi:hypothetical protein AU252_05100 [Pseudarthrobacter sulfonivorans]|uniref:Uncharacterized protein n=1 Tax=Pseudarthrobacter sulfonivorans TaxID=121292 RepID=A0A0U3NUV2_9MICC|nr:hypothetical protein [Pseudarthrobacter sulfonivorans]ALV40623.1 hypothetical protein AU252_05100 [Pseudarthrobacter sulfonivorans]